MNSNMMAGERRWASARRGGMTVLGKVAVPKPLNLPSQRLENHGLDPNVEIVPRGTLSWGSRPSSSGSNPWISSSSPNADGGNVSPSHLSGRPSSGGSGTRPSTAGSDRTQEPVGNAWGSNSRPSSASGTLSSSQTSSSTLRPRSAENRPNSSQLSRFAEPPSKSSVAWGPSSTAERLGVKPSKEDGFSLSSGDFPTLGSEKDNLATNIESGDCGRPSSASGRMAQIKEDTKFQADIKHGTVNTWRPDGNRGTEDDIHPSMEKWPGEHHQFINANAAPQHFDTWQGPPANGPGGVWYGGRPRGPAFGGPVPPGGFPGEPFPYYHPQMPPPPLAGSQPVPHRGPGPRGPQPKNGDFYRPKVHDTYARPGMPFRPGFYPGPPGPPGPMAFEVYGRPPMGYCNNERELPYMGMATGPPVYNGYVPPRLDISDSHGRTAGHPAGRMPGQMESDHLGETQGPKRALLKKHNEYDDQREQGENQKSTMQPNASYPGKNRLPIISKKNEWGAEVDAEEALSSKRTTPNEISSHSSEYQVHSADNMKVKSFEGMGNVKAVNVNCRNDSENVPSFPPEKLTNASEKDSSKSAAVKNSVLMHKIDGLNAKVRVFDGRNDGSSGYNRDEDRNRSLVVDSKNKIYPGEVGNTAEHFEQTPGPKDFVSVPYEVISPVGDKPQSMAVVSRRPSHGGQGRVDHRGKGKFGQEADGWRRKPPNNEPSSAVIASNIESAPIVNANGPNIVVVEGDSAETYELSDNQRDKMRELAKQRALQRQREEEERNREQMAKAFAKLEELNRRTSAGEVANLKADQSHDAGDILREQELSAGGESVVDDRRPQVPGLNLVSNPEVITVDDASNANMAGENTGSPLSMHEDAHKDNAQKEASWFNEGGISRHKRTGYKQKNNISLQKSLNEISVPIVTSDTQKDHALVATGDITSHEDPSCEIKPNESNVPNMSSSVADPVSSHQRRKSNRTGKNKYKVAETPSVPALQQVPSDTNTRKELIETAEPKDSQSNMDSFIPNMTEHSGVQGQDISSSLPGEESQGRVSNHWKPNTLRKLPRNQQSNRFMGKPHAHDTAVWAPVPTQNKPKVSVAASQNFMPESSVDASQNAMQESANNSTKGDSTAQNSSRGKRAEMERYVPKPVAKEMAQQGSIPPIPSSSRSSRLSEGPEREQSGPAGSAASQPVSSVTSHVWPSVENEGDGNHDKPKKDHGMWKQRSSTDTSHMKVLQFGDIPVSEATKGIQQSKESVQLVKSEINSANSEPKSSGSIISTGGNNILNNPTAATVSKYPSARDHGATGRGKKHPPRDPISIGNNPDSENCVGETDGIEPVVNQADRAVASKDNRIFGERTSSQWQPKSQLTPENNQQGNRPTGIESETAEINRPPRKDNPHRRVQNTPRHDKESVNAAQLQQGQSVDVESHMNESIVRRHQEIEREKKPAPAKRRPYSPNHDPLGSGEPASIANTDDQIEHNIPSGSRRNTRQNNRFSRGYESRGDWSAGHDIRPRNAPSFRDNRQRQSVHYEYQPIGQPADRGAENMDHRHRGGGGGGQNHAKRGGNYYRRQTGGSSAHLDSQD